jgi:hypothetical protein
MELPQLPLYHGMSLFFEKDYYWCKNIDVKVKNLASFFSV